MIDPLPLIVRHHGVVRRADLLEYGLTDVQISHALRSGALDRIRNGWFITPSAPPDAAVAAAVKARCALTGPQALALRGAWDVKSPLPHFRAARAHHARPASRHLVLSRKNERYVPVARAVDPVDVAFECALQVLPLEQVVCIGDSLIHRRLLTHDELVSIAKPYGEDARHSIERINGRAESGTETLVRLWLEDMGIEFEQQKPFFAINGRTDFLVGRRLIIEVDSMAHHSSAAQQQSDYTRDQVLKSLGYRVFRVTYNDVMHNWAAVSQYILALVRRGEHRTVPYCER